MAQERPVHRGRGSETKGGGLRGGPKRWTGKGPQPARHIPWPEIFKHHISLVEGHLKMIDMVRKHTVEGSGNWRTICQLIDRTNEILRVAKDQARTFVPPHDARERVPLGSSSISMYPGYSPADHEYGKAAEEYGRFASAARAQGIDIAPQDLEYEIGKAKGAKRQQLGSVQAERAARESGSGSGTGSGSERPNNKHWKPDSTNGHAQVEDTQEKSHEEQDESEKPAFFIDVNPTPVDLPPMKAKSPKRGASSPEPVEDKKKHKKIKKKHAGDLPGTTDGKSVEYEDISQEVDARLKEKEEKRKHKTKERKHRRSSGDSAAVEAETPSAATKPEKPKKKKLKKTDNSDLSHAPEVTDSASKKRQGVDGDNEHGEGKKKKRKTSKGI